MSIVQVRTVKTKVVFYLLKFFNFCHRSQHQCLSHIYGAQAQDGLLIMMVVKSYKNVFYKKFGLETVNRE